VAHIHTRSRIKEIEWLVIAQEIVEHCGVSKAIVSDTIKKLILSGILTYKETIKYHGQWASKMYSIDKVKLKEYMKKPVHSVNWTSSPTEPLPVHSVNRSGLPTEPRRRQEEENIPEEDKKKKTFSGHTSGNNLVVGSYQGANPPAGFSDLGEPYQSAPPAPSLIQGATAVPLRAANDQPDVFAMLDEIPTITQNKMAETLDYRNAQGNRFKENV
jgi:hypothetical protein